MDVVGQPGVEPGTKGLRRMLTNGYSLGKPKKCNRISVAPTDRMPSCLCRDSKRVAGKFIKRDGFSEPNTGPVPNRTADPAICALGRAEDVSSWSAESGVWLLCRKADQPQKSFVGPHFLMAETVILASSPDTSIEKLCI